MSGRRSSATAASASRPLAQHVSPPAASGRAPMSESNLPAVAPMDDLELVIRYLNQQLEPEIAEQVRVRLENDPEFYNLAEPLLFAWRIPRHVDRHPRPPGELEEMWDRFTRRAGFVHQRQRA